MDNCVEVGYATAVISAVPAMPPVSHVEIDGVGDACLVYLVDEVWKSNLCCGFDDAEFAVQFAKGPVDVAFGHRVALFFAVKDEDYLFASHSS